jgi:uncharacterized protein
MPWANGKGTTVEMLRIDGPSGLLLRLSRASVVEDGPFSIFPGIERNLTVISGPGFDLTGGGTRLRCLPLMPVAFAGDVPMVAVGVGDPCDDFNVMTARSLPRARVIVAGDGAVLPGGCFSAVYALAPAKVAGRSLTGGDLLTTREQATISTAGQVICVTIAGLDLAGG